MQPKPLVTQARLAEAGQAVNWLNNRGVLVKKVTVEKKTEIWVSFSPCLRRHLAKTMDELGRTAEHIIMGADLFGCELRWKESLAFFFNQAQSAPKPMQRGQS